MKAETHEWHGAKGGPYEYHVFEVHTLFNTMPANFIYVAKTPEGDWKPIYVGETSDMSAHLLGTHDKQDCIERHGATHIHVHMSSPSGLARKMEQLDLIARHMPPCYDQ